MSKRPPLFLACFVYAVLGLVLGLADFRERIAFPIARLAQLEKFVHPRATLWIQGLRGPADTLEALERPLTALLVVLILAALGLLGALLNPRFRLLKPPGQEVGSGAGAHLDVPLLFRAGLGTLLSLWLAGALMPVAATLSSGGRRSLPLFFALGGLPLWTSSLPGILAPLLHGLLLGPALWLIWGPGGLVTREQDGLPLRTALWGLMAGAALAPAIIVLHAGRSWIAQASTAFSLVDRPGWQGLLVASLLTPVLAMLYAAITAGAFRPRPVSPIERVAAVGGALLAVFMGVAALEGGQLWLAMLDVDGKPLQRVVEAPVTDQYRFAVILMPDGRGVLSSAPDGSISPPYPECLNCYEAGDRITRFLEARNWRTGLVFRAFQHLHDCTALGWDVQRNLELNVQMLERAPTPVLAQHLRDRFRACPVTPGTRAQLDRLADPSLFVWPQPVGNRWLGAAYLRFGDRDRGRRLLMNAQLPQAELRQWLQVDPLTDGTVSGQLTIGGRAQEGVMVGLVPSSRVRTMVGISPASEWRHVLASAYTDKQGRFVLRNLPEDEYLLVATGGGIGRFRGEPLGIGAPGLIRLNRFNANQRLRPVDIRFVRPLRAPRDEGPSVTT